MLTRFHFLLRFEKSWYVDIHPVMKRPKREIVSTACRIGYQTRWKKNNKTNNFLIGTFSTHWQFRIYFLFNSYLKWHSTDINTFLEMSEKFTLYISVNCIENRFCPFCNIKAKYLTHNKKKKYLDPHVFLHMNSLKLYKQVRRYMSAIYQR